MLKTFLSGVSIAIVALAITACEPVPKGKLISTTYETMTLVDFKRPKHAKATMQELSGFSRQVSLGKHCNGWKNRAVIGKQYKVKLNRYETTQKDGVVTHSVVIDKYHLKSQLCN